MLLYVKGGDEMKKVHKWLYFFSLLTWLANIALIIINIFVDLFAITAIFLFVSVMIQAILSGAFSYTEPERSISKNWFDRVLLVSKISSFLCMGLGAVSMLIAGGRARIVNEMYCIVDHSKVVAVISENWFVYLSVCEYLLLFFGILIFTTFMFSRVRTLYLIQKSDG